MGQLCPLTVSPATTTVAVVLSDGRGVSAGQGAHYSLLVHRRVPGGFEALHYDSLQGTHTSLARTAHASLAGFTMWGGTDTQLLTPAVPRQGPGSGCGVYVAFFLYTLASALRTSGPLGDDHGHQ